MIKADFRTVLTSVPLLILFSATFAQTQTADLPVIVQCSGPQPPTAPLPLRMAPISGAPYSGDEEEYSDPPVQVLSRLPENVAKRFSVDSVRALTHVYRDSEGRIRREVSTCPGSSPDDSVMIEIRDPVAGTQYILDPRSHVARRSVLTVINPGENNLSISANPRGEGVVAQNSEELGTQTIEGLLTTGTKVTRTFPKELGGPVDEVCENWVSPDLHVLVLRKCSRRAAPVPSGEYGTRLTHITRGEPDPTLFQLPASYRIVDRAILGVNVQELNPTMAKQFGLAPFQGVLVGDVQPNTPAFRAGLKRGDVILKVDNKPVHAPIELTSQVSVMTPGTAIGLEIWRDGGTDDIKVTLGGTGN
jgi:PDZ domain-containing protein